MRSLLTELVHVLMQWPLYVVISLAWWTVRAWPRWGGLRRSAALLLGLAAYVVSAPATANAMLRWVESRWPVPGPEALRATAPPGGPRILVLSAGWFRTTPTGHVVVMGAASWERTATAVALWRQTGGTLIFSGAPLPDGSDSVAERMAATAMSMGVPMTKVRTERRSRNTYENLRFSADEFGLRDGAPVVLVTSAVHMPRSAAAARGLGLNVQPYPCDFRADTSAKWLHFLPSSEAPGAFEELAHEVFGLWAYRIKGWT